MSLKHGLLGLLQDKPMTGYDLMKVFNKSLNFFWNAQKSQIYRDLGNLEKQGMVISKIEEQTGRPDKKVFYITPVGREEFKTWINNCDFSSSLSYRDPVLIKIFFGAHGDVKKIVSGLEDYILANEEHLVALKRTTKIINDCSQNPESLYEDAQYMKMTLSRGVFIAKSNIDWAKECMEMLKNG